MFHAEKLPPPPLVSVRPWRMAAFTAGAIATLELVLLVVAAVALFAKPFTDHVEKTAAATVAKAAAQPLTPPRVQKAAVHAKRVPAARLDRRETSILVLNGNGRTGAAGEASSVLQGLSYTIAGTADAPRHDFARSIVMYRSGFAGEAWRLAKDARVKRVAPLDGMKASDLQGAHVVLILGERP